MPSPFPGMDPWLESFASSRSFHGSLIYLLQETLNESLPKEYLANAEELIGSIPNFAGCLMFPYLARR